VAALYEAPPLRYGAEVPLKPASAPAARPHCAVLAHASVSLRDVRAHLAETRRSEAEAQQACFYLRAVAKRRR